jgi:hypothetical protein
MRDRRIGTTGSVFAARCSGLLLAGNDADRRESFGAVERSRRTGS